MSHRVLFSFSTGISKPIVVQKGTLENIKERVHLTEEALGLEVEQYRDNPKYWKSTEPEDGVSDKLCCQVAEEHNNFIRWLYHHFTDHAEVPFPGDSETITPEQIAPFWHGLVEIDVPVERWTRDYYVARMEELYESMRGRGEVIIFDSKPLTERQAADVINIFAGYLDKHDVRLDSPGTDSLAGEDDGGYYWCEKCGAVTEQHAAECKKRKCPIKAEWGEE